MKRISSAHNPQLKLARKLLTSSRERQHSGKILLDGVHLVSAYAARFSLSGAVILLNESAAEASEIATLIETLPDDAQLLRVSASAFRGISPVETPTGVIALCDRPVISQAGSNEPFVLLLDGIQNPGNLGSILRTAAATAATEVLLTASCADPWSPKCLRGGMGAQFVLPVRHAPDPQQVVRSFEGRRMATSPRDGRPLIGADLGGPLLVIFGSEGAGLPHKLLSSADMTVHIPLRPEMESLNVAAAVAMFCYERLRQALP